ncbi:MAG: DUF4166 domain-containing protein [Novosphingobium sp.]
MATQPQIEAEIIARQAAEPAYDSRFRRLVGAAAWEALRPAIRRRFSKRLQGTAVALYAGEIVETRLSAAGWLLGQACRLIGAPLPLYRDAGVPAVVVVSEDGVSGGQRWTRIYHRRRGTPQVVNSAKTFAGPTGLEELVGGGIGMALAVHAAEDRLVFASTRYFLKLGRRRLPIPAALSPGRTTVTHRDLGEGRFAFDLEVVHPWFGTLVRQHALFHDQ